MGKIVAIIGKAGSGKDTLAKMLLTEAEFAGLTSLSLAFATPLKEFAGKVFSLTHEQLYGASEYRNAPIEGSTAEAWWVAAEYKLFDLMNQWLLAVIPPSVSFKAARAQLYIWFYSMWGLQVSPRYLLQTLGTEFGRRVHKDIWSLAGLRKANGYLNSGVDLAVITDCRFLNEAEQIRSAKGEVWRIERPAQANTATTGVANHPSEMEQDSAEMNQYIVRNIQNIGTLSDLQMMARALVSDIVKAVRQT